MKLFVNVLLPYDMNLFSGASMISAQETQTSSVIMSDTLSIDADGNMIATGNVQVFHRDQRLKAPKIIFRKTPEADFNSGSGLRRKSSDLLVSAGFDTQNGITILARALLNEDNAPNRAEALFDYAKDNISFSTGFSYLPASIDEEREESISELRLAAGHKVGQNWTFSGDTRYDITDGRAARAGIGISFDNECTTVHFSAAREFSKAGSASSLTSWNLIASLKGFGTGGNRTPIVKNCGE